MTNAEKYKEAFVKGLGISADSVEGLVYQSISEWDSVGHMELVATIEETFDIMLETDDIIELNSFEKGKEILSKNYNIVF